MKFKVDSFKTEFSDKNWDFATVCSKKKTLGRRKSLSIFCRPIFVPCRTCRLGLAAATLRAISLDLTLIAKL